MRFADRHRGFVHPSPQSKGRPCTRYRVIVHKVTPILISLLLANMPSAVTPPFSRRVDGTFNAVQAFRRPSRTCMRPCTPLVKCDESIAPHTRRGGRMTNRRDYHKRPGNDARSRGRYVSLMEYMLASAAW